MGEESHKNANGPLLTVRQAAAALAVSERSVWTLTSDGTLPCVRLAKKIVRFDWADILKLIETRKHRGSGRGKAT